MSGPVEQDQIEVHWQHPRTELELPLLLVWPHPTVNEWVATVENGVATVVCHQELYEADTENGGTEVRKRAEEIGVDEEIPTHVATALLDYEGNFGPVHTVANPYEEPEAPEDRQPDRHPMQRTLQEVGE